ncbi:STAS domain-containing protein [Streptomyces sp. NPDC005423]|uniref:STAS domain-containing protein n=1 Tax=Streptomyces sp. NPDC005423 TaxID=3155343 RepID=UPI0033B58B81
MTTVHPAPSPASGTAMSGLGEQRRLRLTSLGTGTTVRLGLRGDLDHDSAGLLLEAVTGELAARPGLRALRLGCAGLGFVDSMGLSILLMVRRRTDEADVALYLEERTPALDRLLALTGTLEYLTAPPAGAGGFPAAAGVAARHDSA